MNNNYEVLIKTLRDQAIEIAKADIAGWGNTMTWAADTIEQLLSERTASKQEAKCPKS